MATDLASAQENHAYSQTITAVGAQGPLEPGSWEVDAFGGTLPPGLLLNTTTGEIYGTPTAGSANTYPFTIILEDAAGTTCSKDYSIRVRPDPFHNAIWTLATIIGTGAVAEAVGSGDRGMVYVVANYAAGSQPYANAKGSISINNTGAAILCRAEFLVTVNNYYVTPVGTFFSVKKGFVPQYSTAAPAGGNGIPLGPYNYAFTIPAGLVTSWDFEMQVSVSGAPPPAPPNPTPPASSIQIYLHIEVL